jgi:hypothetical protein
MHWYLVRRDSGHEQTVTEAGVGNDPGRNRKCPSEWTESKPGSELGKGREGQGLRFPLFSGFYRPVGTVVTFLIHIRDGVTSTCRKFGKTFLCSYVHDLVHGQNFCFCFGLILGHQQQISVVLSISTSYKILSLYHFCSMALYTVQYCILQYIYPPPIGQRCSTYIKGLYYSYSYYEKLKRRPNYASQ